MNFHPKDAQHNAHHEKVKSATHRYPYYNFTLETDTQIRTPASTRTTYLLNTLITC